MHEKNGKRRRLNPAIANTEEDANTDEAQDGCEWGPGPTCAYDSIVTTLYYAHKQLLAELREDIKHKESLVGEISRRFDSIQEYAGGIKTGLTLIRDEFSTRVRKEAATTLRLDVSDLMNAEDVIATIFANKHNISAGEDSERRCVLRKTCRGTGVAVQEEDCTLPNFMIVSDYCGNEGRKSVQNWVKVLYGEEQMKRNFTEQWTQRNQCECEEHERNLVFERAPAILWVGLPNGHDYDINKSIQTLERTHRQEHTTVTYTIKAIIFLNEREQHYYSKIYMGEWKKKYDGMQNGGKLKNNGVKADDFSAQGVYVDKEERWCSKKAVIVVYTRTATR